MNLYDIRSVLGVRTAEYVDLSPLLTNRLHALSNDWLLKIQSENEVCKLRGPYTDRASKVIMLVKDEPLKIFRALVHEVGHAMYTPDWHHDPSILSTQNKSLFEYQAALVTARTKDEGEAVLTQFDVAYDIYRNTKNRQSGPINIGTGLPEETEQQCLEAYIRYIRTLQLCNTDTDRNNLREQARYVIGKIYTDLVPDPDNDPRSYDEIFSGQAKIAYENSIEQCDQEDNTNSKFLRTQSIGDFSRDELADRVAVYQNTTQLIKSKHLPKF